MYSEDVPGGCGSLVRVLVAQKVGWWSPGGVVQVWVQPMQVVVAGGALTVGSASGGSRLG